MVNKTDFPMKNYFTLILFVLFCFVSLEGNCTKFKQISDEIEVHYFNSDIRLCGSGDEYKLTIKNISENSISGLTISYDLPNGFDYVDIVSSTLNTSEVQKGNNPLFSVDEIIPSGEIYELVFRVRPPPAFFLKQQFWVRAQ